MALGRHSRPHNKPEDPDEVMGTLHEMAATMKEQAIATHQMMERMEQRDEENPEEHNEEAEVDLEYLMFAEYRKANSLSFRGAYNPHRANEWIKAIENIFTVLACTKEQKVAFSIYMLEADVEFWWLGTMERAQTHVTWDVCKMHFHEKYFPTFVRNAKELEFMSICQGTMNVTEYTAKFKELCNVSTIYQKTRMSSGGVSSLKKDCMRRS